ncbi:MAG: hypothetical protein MUP47_10750 [Phycisphaerae bacterium]|nr:hypothetical protein [Phycisphaerae bacterium]
MATLTLGPTPHTDTILQPILPRVYVDGRRQRDLKVLTWDVLGPPTFGRVVLLLHRSAQPTRAVRMEEAGELPPIGASVVVRPGGLEGAVDFQGVVMAHHLELAEDGEHLAVEVEHRLAQALSGTLSSRWHLVEGHAQVLPNTRVRFNQDALASATRHQFGGCSARLFDASASARRWTVADALAYIIATAVPVNVRAPNRWELESLAGGLDVGMVEITGLTVAEALTRVAARAGLEVRSARQGVGVECYRPGVSGPPSNITLQRAGAALDPSHTNLWRGQVVIRRRPARRPVLALGATHCYESTFTLAPGWNPALQTARWRDFVRSHSPNWALLADVYRKWVLNEHGWYSVAPWLLPAGDLAAISADDFPLCRPRRLLPCLSCDLNGASLGVVVESSCGSGAPWRPWQGPVWISRDECAVYLGGDALPGDFFQAAADGEASVRVTATVEADVRLTAELAGDPGLTMAVIDASKLIRRQKVHPSSVFAGRQDLGPPDERDDSEALEELAQRHAEVVSTALEGTLTLGWVDVSCHVGDTVEQVKNRSIELRPSPGRLAFVRSVRHDFGPAQCTTIELEG